MYIVVRTLGCLFACMISNSTKTIYVCSFFICKLFGSCISSRSSKRKLRSTWLNGLLDFSESRVDIEVGELDEILISICFLFLFVGFLFFCHGLLISYKISIYAINHILFQEKEYFSFYLVWHPHTFFWKKILIEFHKMNKFII